MPIVLSAFNNPRQYRGDTFVRPSRDLFFLELYSHRRGDEPNSLRPGIFNYAIDESCMEMDAHKVAALYSGFLRPCGGWSPDLRNPEAYRRYLSFLDSRESLERLYAYEVTEHEDIQEPVPPPVPSWRTSSASSPF